MMPNYSDIEFQAGSGVVDTPLEAMKIAGYPTSETPTNIGIRCFHSWLGAVCLDQNASTGGVWGKQEMALHQELLAAWLGLQCYASNLRETHVHLNTAAVAHINNMGGVHSEYLCSLALEVWDWCLCQDLTISAEHLPGSMNQLADRESRIISNSSEWAPDMQIF